MNNPTSTPNSNSTSNPNSSSSSTEQQNSSTPINKQTPQNVGGDQKNDAKKGDVVKENKDITAN